MNLANLKIILPKLQIAIEILSPEQNSNRVIDKLLHGLHYGCRLGWLIDASDRCVLVFTPRSQIDIYRGDRPLPVLPEIDLQVSGAEMFSWLKMGES